MGDGSEPVRMGPDFEQDWPGADARATDCVMNLVLAGDQVVERIADILRPLDLTPAVAQRCVRAEQRVQLVVRQAATRHRRPLALSSQMRPKFHRQFRQCQMQSFSRRCLENPPRFRGNLFQRFSTRHKCQNVQLRLERHERIESETRSAPMTTALGMP